MDNGVLYISFGSQYYKQTEKSIYTLRKNGKYTGSIHIVTDEIGQSFFIENIPNITTSIRNFNSISSKCNMNLWSPFRKTLYLDCDTIIANNINDIQSYCGFCIAIDQYKTITMESMGRANEEEKIYTFNYLDGTGVNYNTGVILFESYKNTHLFDMWHKECAIFNGCDQAALNRILNKQDFNITILDKIWNIPSNKNYLTDQQKRAAKIVHVCSGKEDIFPQK